MFNMCGQNVALTLPLDYKVSEWEFFLIQPTEEYERKD